MTKVLFILSAVVMLVASFFAYQNGQAFTKVRNEAIALNKQVETQTGAVTAMVADIQKVVDSVKVVQQELDVESEKVKAQKLKIAQADNETKRNQEDLDGRNKKLVELKTQMDKLPKNVKPETLVEDINRIKQEIAELNSQAELKKKEVDAEASKVGEAEKALGDLVRKIEDRKKSFDRNSLTARVVAVNHDWGFVVIDAGQRAGITEATKLLITRGTQTVGKLNIISIQGNRTIANIVPETVVEGMSVAPGDRVILENLFQ